ncbi:MAG: PDZ domain-containing protein [Candidatus Aminicenantes bacterium]|nr:PDZ domain-containing protein [Candidatus Aminicenantes bacterium]
MIKNHGRKVMTLKKTFAVFVALTICTGVLIAQQTDQTLRLEIGNPLYKNKTMMIESGKIYSARKGKAVTFDEMIEEMANARFVYVGETHNSLPMHDTQFQIAEALYMQDRNFSMGLEMFDVNWQEKLNQWSHGLLSRDEFIDQAKWYENWNFNFNFYQKIFELAKKYHIPLYALNAPREIIRKIRMRGWDALSDKEKTIVPKPDLSNKDHRFLMETIFGGAEMPEAMKGRQQIMFEGLYRAQSAWDEVMAYNTVQAARIEKSRVLVLAGSGHLLYNLGINRRVKERISAPLKTVICIEVPKGEQRIQVSRSLADFIWGLPFEEKPAFPSFGIALKKVEGLANPVIERDPISGVAQGQDFKKGDVILYIDGKQFASINDLRTYLSRFNWGDEVCFRMLRGGVEIETTLTLEQTNVR